jgi:signal transduction histidine kinase
MRFYMLILALLVSGSVFPQNKEQAQIDSLQMILARTQKDPSLSRASTLNTLGRIYLKTSDYTHAMQSFAESLGIAEKFDNEELTAATYKNMSIVYFEQHDYEKALTSCSKAFSIFDRINNLPEKALLLKLTGDNYLEMGDSAKATKYYNAALPVFKQAGDKKSEASVYSNQSILCNSDYQHKIELALQAKKIWDLEPPGNVLPEINTGNIGVAYLDIVRYNRIQNIKPSVLIPAGRNELLVLAEKYLKEAIRMSDENNDIENSSYFTGVMAELQAEKGDFKNAYYNIRKYQDITDSIFSQENKNKIAALENRQAMEVKNAEIETGKLQISNQRRNLWLLISCIAFLATVGGLMLRLNISRKKTNAALLKLNKELDEANKIKAKFFGILSHDLRSPVASLINFLRLQKLERGYMNEQQVADSEEKITTSAKFLLQNMETMLLWSKGQMEYFKPIISDVPVISVFSYLRKFFADEERVAITFLGGDSLIIQTDEHFLQTIAQNLTANAVNALQKTPDAQITWKAWQDDRKVRLSISDNGPGTNDEQLKALYNETAVTDSKHGLGLHIIRDLAKAIGCSITSRTNAGHGTVFIIGF